MIKKLIPAVVAVILMQGVSASAQEKKPANSPGMQSVDLTIMKSLSDFGDAVPADAVYADPQADPAARAIDVVRRLTFEEKLNLCGGWNKFLFPGVERLGLRPVSMADASQGLRTQTSIIKEHSTSFPSMLALASTWNEELALAFGRDMGEECRAFGVDMLLGPGVNLQRFSVGGRNFEYMGEDPILSGKMNTAYVKGIQEKGIIAVPKHFVCNDQEFCRHIASSNVDERTLREIYLTPWEMVIKQGGALGLMTGNNLLNGLPNTMNRPVMQSIIRDEYGFKGLAMTDWQNTNYFPALQSLFLTSGETLLMPENAAFRVYVDACRGNLERMQEIEVLLEKIVFENLYPLFAQGVYDRPFNIPSNFGLFGDHADFAARCGAEAIIMLKNDKGILPVKAGKKILLMGGDELHSGKGSGFVEGYSHCDYETGLREVYGDALSCSTNPTDAQIKKADVVIFRLSKSCGEGNDIPFEEPADQIKELLRVSKLNKNIIVVVTAANPMPTGWLSSVKGVLWTSYLGQTRGKALAAVVSGAESPSGKLPFTIEKNFADSQDPDFNYIGGKPYWIGNNQYKAYWLGLKKENVRGFSDFVKPGEVIQVDYSEGVFMGYRWWDKSSGAVAFPFGYGLSYTTFAYEGMEVEGSLENGGVVTVKVKVRNSGKVAGKETVQLYVSDPECSVERPEKELKAFSKISLQPGESRVVEFGLCPRAFSFWDVESHGWKVEAGRFDIKAGPDSAHLPLVKSIEL